MKKYSKLNFIVGFISLSMYILAAYVLLNPYNECGGPPCEVICSTVCVPTGIKYHIPISVALITIATLLALYSYKKLKRDRV